MTDQQISALINVLRYTNKITPLQKEPLDTDAAHRQIVSNNMNHPDLFVAISAMPDVIQKPFDAVTQEDMIFNLRHQLEGLAAKEMEAHINGYIR